MSSTSPTEDPAQPAIETVLFDLDDTLIQYRRSPGEVLQASFEAVGVDELFPVAAYYDRFEEFAEKTKSMAELRAECFATLAAERGHDPALGRAVADAFDAERDQSNVELCQGVPDVLESLAADHRLGIVTNGARDAQRRKIAAVDLGRWMETTVVAGDEVPPKLASALRARARCARREAGNHGSRRRLARFGRWGRGRGWAPLGLGRGPRRPRQRRQWERQRRRRPRRHGRARTDLPGQCRRRPPDAALAGRPWSRWFVADALTPVAGSGEFFYTRGCWIVPTCRNEFWSRSTGRSSRWKHSSSRPTSGRTRS